MWNARLVALTLGLSLVGTSLTAHAQSTPNLDWASILLNETDPSVSASKCGTDICVTLPNNSKPNSGTAAIEHVSYGDIVGDGGMEAVVRIDSGGSIGPIGSLVYRVDGANKPRLVTANGPWGNVSIDPALNELVSITADFDICSSTTCSQYVRTDYKLVSGALQQQDTCKFSRDSIDQTHPLGTCTNPQAGAQASQSHSTSAPAPASSSAGADLSNLAAFPGPVLVMPLDQPPYSSWGFVGAQAYASAAAGTFYSETVGEARQGIGSDGISIQGITGSDTWDQPTAFGCQLSTAYCYQPPDPAHRQGGAIELFGQLTARGNPAYVVHGTFPSELWRLVWFDETADVTYQLVFTGDDVITTFEPLDTWSQNNASAAQQLASMADQLTVWNSSSATSSTVAPAASASGSASSSTPAAAGPGDPADAVQAFYGLLNGGDFEDAWNMYNPRYTSSHSFDSWAKGYATTQSVTVLSATTTSQTDTTASVDTTIQSVDKQADGKLLTQQFQGTWNLVLVDGNWKLDTASIKKVG